MPKLAVCFQGGGSRGTYSAGAIEILLRNEIIADEVYGTSCGALMACNYVSQEPTRAYEQTLFLANDKHFFHPFSLFSKGTMFDYAYLFNVITAKTLPFDLDRFRQNPCKFYVVVSNCLTGETEYLEKSEPGFLPQAIAASGALPLTTKPVFFQGTPYLDGGISCPISFERPLFAGFEKIVVVATRERGYRKTKMRKDQLALVRYFYKDYPVWLKLYERNLDIYNAQMDKMDSLNDQGRIFVIYPSLPPKVSHSETDESKLRELMKMGKEDAQKALPALKTYLSK